MNNGFLPALTDGAPAAASTVEEYHCIHQEAQAAMEFVGRWHGSMWD